MAGTLPGLTYCLGLLLAKKVDPSCLPDSSLPRMLLPSREWRRVLFTARFFLDGFARGETETAGW
jgi:hypothetical protein